MAQPFCCFRRVSSADSPLIGSSSTWMFSPSCVAANDKQQHQRSPAAKVAAQGSGSCGWHSERETNVCASSRLCSTEHLYVLGSAALGCGGCCTFLKAVVCGG